MPRAYEVRCFADDRALTVAAAADWLALLPQFPNPTVALSGGRIAQPFFAAVARLAREMGNPLANVHFFWADERCVPPDDPESNFRLAHENLFEPLNLQRVHRLKGELPPAQAVAEANDDIRRTVPASAGGMPSLDLVFLGLGENGHVASLMPNAPPQVEQCQEPYAHVPNSPKPPPNRITLTYPMLAGARHVWMLAAGAGKAGALRESLRPGGTTPFARVLQSRSHTRVYTDLNENLLR